MTCLELFNLIKVLKFREFESSHTKRLQRRCFPVNIEKFLRAAFFIEYLRWLLLKFADKYLFSVEIHKDHKAVLAQLSHEINTERLEMHA